MVGLLAELLPLSQLRRGIDEADRRRLFDPREVEALLARSPGRHGLKPLGVLLDDFQAVPLHRSELEELFARLCERFELPRPVTNARIAGFEVDALWLEQKLVVEVDSREHHLNGAAFEADRQRDAELLAVGHRVMRVTYRQLKRQPDAVARRLRKALAAR